MKLRLWIIALMAALMAAPTWAQVGDDEGDGPPRGRGEGRRARGDDDRGGRGERGDRGPGGRRGGRRGGPQIGRMLDDIAEELGFTDEQKAQLEEIKAAHRERREQFRERFRAIREARDAGNDELADQLREEMRAEMEENGGPGGMMEHVFDDLDPILTESQRGQLAEMRQRFETEQRERRERFADRMFQDMANELELNEEQLGQFEEISNQVRERMRQFMETRRAIRQARREGNDELADQLRAELEEAGDPREMMREAFDSLESILDDEQKAKLQEMRERGPGRRDRGRRGDRRGPDRGEATPGALGQLTEELDLDASQQEKVRAFIEENRATNQATQVKLRELRLQMREARRSGDEAKAAELQGQIEKLQADQLASEEALLDRVNGILRADQRAALAEHRANLKAEREMSDFPADLRTTIRAAMKVRLTKAQRKELKKIRDKARKELRDARKEDRKNRSRERTAEKALAASVKAEIVAMLDDAQKTKYEETLRKLTQNRRGSQRQWGGRGNRGGRNGGRRR